MSNKFCWTESQSNPDLTLLGIINFCYIDVDEERKLLSLTHCTDNTVAISDRLNN